MLRRWLLTSTLTIACMSALLLIYGTRADAAIITGGCADTNVSCTMPELISGAFFAVNGNLFANFDVLEGPSSASVVVSPICVGCGAFGGARLVPGFLLDFGGTFTLAEKGRTVSFILEYDFFPSLTTFEATSAFLLPGTVNGAGDSVHIDLFSSGYPGPDLTLSCPPLGCPSNTIFGTTQPFFSPTSTHFHVFDDISMSVDDFTGGTPFVQLNSFSQTFRAVPEPSSIAMLITGLLAVCALTMLRSRRSGAERPSDA